MMPKSYRTLLESRPRAGKDNTKAHGAFGGNRMMITRLCLILGVVPLEAFADGRWYRGGGGIFSVATHLSCRSA